MRGWILYKESMENLSPSNYETRRFLEVAEQQGIELEVFAPEQFDLIVTKDDRKSILVDGKVLKLPDFVMPRLGSETTYFALAVIRHLERLGVKMFNTSDSIDAVKDKMYTQQILAEHNLPVPKTMLVKYPVDIDLVDKYLGFPVVVKALSGTNGSGVFLSESKENFEDLIQLIHAAKSNANLILQEYISTSRGTDLRVFTVGGRAIACIKRSSVDNNFKANYARGGQVEPHEITPEIEWLATETARALNLDIAGIDLLFDKDHFRICEANSAPGFKGIESCTDMNIPDEIFHFIKFRLGML